MSGATRWKTRSWAVDAGVIVTAGPDPEVAQAARTAKPVMRVRIAMSAPEWLRRSIGDEN